MNQQRRTTETDGEKSEAIDRDRECEGEGERERGFSKSSGCSAVRSTDAAAIFDRIERMELNRGLRSSTGSTGSTRTILYAIAMADYDHDSMEVCKDFLKTKDGINRLALHHSSVGRFSNALGPLIYPIYGQGELPQAFCRHAAVKGCLYVLRMPVNALLMDKDSGSYKGVKVGSGQELFSHRIVLGPSFIVPSPLLKSSPDILQAKLKDFGLQDFRGKVARGICITKSSLKPDVSTFLAVYPPKSLYPEQVASIRVLQIVPISGTPENSNTDESENAEVKPTLLWSALYIQEMATCSFDSIFSTPMPDGNLNYNDLLDATKKLFHMMFPHHEFFPETAFTDPEDDGRFDQSPSDDSLNS